MVSIRLVVPNTLSEGFVSDSSYALYGYGPAALILAAYRTHDTTACIAFTVHSLAPVDSNPPMNKILS